MKKRTKLLSLLLALVMVLSILPLSVLAEETAPTGSVAVMVYSPEFTDIVDHGGLDAIKQWVESGIVGEEFIPPVTLSLTAEDGSQYTLEKQPENVANSMVMTSTNKLTQDLFDRYGSIPDILEQMNNIPFLGQALANGVSKVLSPLDKLAAYAGDLYTTYRVDNVPVGTYTLYVDELDRDGYLLTEDTDRSFTVEVVADKTAYVGTNKSFGKDINLDALGIQDKINNIPGVSLLSGGISDFLNRQYDGLGDFVNLSTLSFWFNFPGLWLDVKDPGFGFKDVNLADDGLADAEFLLVNRDELKKVLDFMINIGKETFTTVLQNLMAQDENGVYTYQEIMELSQSLASMDENGQVQIDAVTGFKLLKTFLGLMDNIDLWGEYQAARADGMVIPAMLKAESEADGTVTFSPQKNVTLVWGLDILMDMAEFGSGLVNEDLQQILDYALTFLEAGKDFTAELINNSIYLFAQRWGLVGNKMPAGNYLMFQTKATEGYFRNPFVYTVIVTWDKADWVWANVADIGIIGPYLAEGFYAFVRNTSIAGIADKLINTLAGKEVNLISRALSNELDVTAAMIAYISQLAYGSLGGSDLYASVEAVTTELNKFLYSQGRTTQNLIIFLNNIAKRSKLVYTGSLDEDWYFYNLNKSLFSNTNMLINRAAKGIEDAIVLPEGQEKTGIITNVATQVTEARAKRGQAISALFKQVVDRASSRSSSIIKSLLASFLNR